MGKLSPFKREQVEILKEKARKLYRQGLTVREVAAVVGKSPAWVSLYTRDLSTGKVVQK